MDRPGFRQAKPSEVFRDHFLTCFISDHVVCNCATRSGSTTSAGRPTTRTRDSMWPGAPEQLHEVLTRQRPRCRGQQDDLRERDALVPLGSVQPHHQGTGDSGRLRRAAEGHDVSVQALSKKGKTGANFVDFAASAKELTGNTD